MSVSGERDEDGTASGMSLSGLREKRGTASKRGLSGETENAAKRYSKNDQVNVCLSFSIWILVNVIYIS